MSGVRSDRLSDSVNPSRFAGVMLPTMDALPYTVAWTLTHLRGALTPRRSGVRRESIPLSLYARLHLRHRGG